jgi:two-component system heavy metal sensor histidine kinase CusS
VQIHPNQGETLVDQLKLRIANSGPGIAAEHIPQLFDRYWHGQDGNNQTDRRSSGLGLAIVKRILDLHDSAVRVMSCPGRMTVFEFNLLRC